MKPYLSVFFATDPAIPETIQSSGGLMRCVEYTASMKLMFPELERVFGHVHLLGGENLVMPPAPFREFKIATTVYARDLAAEASDELAKWSFEAQAEGMQHLQLRAELMAIHPSVELGYERLEWPHGWLLTPSGEVVDPTRWQFPGLIKYEMDDPDDPVTGKCPNCGGRCRRGRYLCSETCEQEFAECVSRGL